MAKIIENYRAKLICQERKKVAAIVLGRWFSGKSSCGSSMKNCSSPQHPCKKPT